MLWKVATRQFLICFPDSYEIELPTCPRPLKRIADAKLLGWSLHLAPRQQSVPLLVLPIIWLFWSGVVLWDEGCR